MHKFANQPIVFLSMQLSCKAFSCSAKAQENLTAFVNPVLRFIFKPGAKYLNCIQHLSSEYCLQCVYLLVFLGLEQQVYFSFSSLQSLSSHSHNTHNCCHKVNMAHQKVSVTRLTNGWYPSIIALVTAPNYIFCSLRLFSVSVLLLVNFLRDV